MFRLEIAHPQARSLQSTILYEILKNSPESADLACTTSASIFCFTEVSSTHPFLARKVCGGGGDREGLPVSQ